MTGCMYLSPPLDLNDPSAGVLAVLFADTMATLIEPEPEAIPILPSTVDHVTAEKSSTVRIVRKLTLLGEAAVAIAGHGETIKYALNELKIHMPDWREGSGERPMRFIGDIAIRVHDMLPKCKWIVVMGACPTMDGRVNSLQGAVRTDTKYYGRCGASGTGARELIETAKNFDEQQAARHQQVVEDNCSIGRTIAFAQSLNSIRLAREIAGQGAKDWGGYIEWAFLDPGQKEWVRGPNTLNLFYVVTPLSDRRFSINSLGRAIAYDPGVDHGRIVSVWISPEGGGYHDFILQDMIAENSSIKPAIEHWATWKPEICTTTFMFNDSTGKFVGSVARSVEMSEIHETVFHFGETGGGFGLPREVIEPICEEVAACAGGVYIPS